MSTIKPTPLSGAACAALLWLALLTNTSCHQRSDPIIHGCDQVPKPCWCDGTCGSGGGNGPQRTVSPSSLPSDPCQWTAFIASVTAPEGPTERHCQTGEPLWIGLKIGRDIDFGAILDIGLTMQPWFAGEAMWIVGTGQYMGPTLSLGDIVVPGERRGWRFQLGLRDTDPRYAGIGAATSLDLHIRRSNFSLPCYQEPAFESRILHVVIAEDDDLLQADRQNYLTFWLGCQIPSSDGLFGRSTSALTPCYALLVEPRLDGPLGGDLANSVREAIFTRPETRLSTLQREVLDALGSVHQIHPLANGPAVWR